MADNLSEVAGARANARAGGPTNAQDAELLRRYSGLDESSRGYSGRNYSGYRAGTIENRRYSRRYNRYDRTGSYNE